MIFVLNHRFYLYVPKNQISRDDIYDRYQVLCSEKGKRNFYKVGIQTQCVYKFICQIWCKWEVFFVCNVEFSDLSYSADSRPYVSIWIFLNKAMQSQYISPNMKFVLNHRFYVLKNQISRYDIFGRYQVLCSEKG